MNILDIIGLKVVAIKGYPNSNKRIKKVNADYLLFDDGKTFLEFEEQDYYTYHDCSSLARHINIYQDVSRWAQIALYPDANHCDFMW